MAQTMQITGNVGRDPELRITGKGTQVCNFTVASNRRYTKADGTKASETIWFNIAAFGRLGENCKTYLHKGSQVRIDGRLRPAEDGNPPIWTSDGGKTYSSFDVVASDVEFLSGYGGNDERDAGDAIPVDEEDFPF